MSKSRDLGEFPAAALDIDASGNLDVTGTVTADGLVVETATGLGVIEVGGPSGAYIDLKSPSSDDYDLRLITEGSGGELNFKDGSLRVRRAADVKLTVDSTGLTVADSLTALGNSIIGNGTISSVSGYTSLNIKSTSGGELQLGNTAGSAQATLWSDASGLTYNNHAATSHIWTTGSSEKMRVTAAGNVGIGTSSPSAKLSVSSDAPASVPALGTASSHLAVDYAGIYGTMVGSLSNGNGYIQQQRFSGSATAYNLLVQPNGGNVGIGTSSPSAKLEVRNDVSASTDLDPTAIKLYNNSDGGSAIEFSNAVSGKSKISFGVQGGGGSTDDTYLGFSTSLNAGSLLERMRIDSSGNVGIGTSSPTAAKLQVETASGGTALKVGTATQGLYLKTTGNVVDYNSSGNATGMHTFSTGDNERVRIDNNGTVMFGKSDSNPAVDGFLIGSTLAGVTSSGAASANNTYHVYKTGAGAGYKFYVSFTGTVNYTALSQLSDEREKKNIVDIPHGLKTIMSLKPRCFDWNGDEEANGVFGFIAQEVETVLPSLIGEYKKDEGVTRKSLSQVELIPVLTKAIQEQQTLIEALTARITALEAK